MYILSMIFGLRRYVTNNFQAQRLVAAWRKEHLRACALKPWLIAWRTQCLGFKTLQKQQAAFANQKTIMSKNNTIVL